MAKKIFLIRDSSKLSENVENFLIDKKISYDVLYTQEIKNVPLIYHKDRYTPYEGKIGFNIFKDKLQKLAS